MSITREELKKYRKASYFAENYNLQAGSMRNYADKGYIRHIRTAGDHRNYHIDDIDKLLYIINDNTKNSTLTREEKLLKYVFNNEETQHEVICYSRVDNRSQIHRLERESLLFKTHVPHCQIIQEIGNEDDLERKELKMIINRCYEGKVKYIITTTFRVLANDMFKIIKTTLDINKVELIILRTNGVMCQGPDYKHDEDNDVSSAVRMLIRQRYDFTH